MNDPKSNALVEREMKKKHFIHSKAKAKEKEILNTEQHFAERVQTSTSSQFKSKKKKN